MRDIKQLHPRLQTIIPKLQTECTKQGIAIGIGECLRTVAEQDALYAKGRTASGSIVTNAKGSSYSSMHQWGVAFDFYLDMDIDGDGKTSDDTFNNSKSTFNKIGAIGKKFGLEWGGDWTAIKDLPHFQLPDWGSTASTLKRKYGTPEKFMATWKASDQWIQDEKGWWYKHVDGSYTKADWEKIDGNWYYFNASGYMVTGWQKVKGIWYYLDASGKMLTGWQQISGTWYYMKDTGAMIENDWLKDNGKWYWLKAGGAMAKNELLTIDGKQYVFLSDGHMGVTNSDGALT